MAIAFMIFTFNKGWLVKGNNRLSSSLLGVTTLNSGAKYAHLLLSGQWWPAVRSTLTVFAWFRVFWLYTVINIGDVIHGFFF
jgi:hypothetical protein